MRCLASTGKGRLDLIVAGDIDLEERAADFRSNRSADDLVHVEDRDLGALGRQHPGGRLAQPRSAARHNRGDIRTQVHRNLLPSQTSRLVPASAQGPRRTAGEDSA
jgi:hypothetical protein